MKLITRLLSTTLLAVNFLQLSTHTLLAQAENISSNWNNPDQPATFKDLEIVFSNLLGVIVPLAGAAVFVMFIIGGFSYMTSGGNPEKSAKAGATLTWAVVGLLFLLGAWFMLRFVSQFTGIDVTLFKIIPVEDYTVISNPS